MNMRYSDPAEQKKVVLEYCQQITPSDENFAPWLEAYIEENPRTWLGNGKEIDYWLVPTYLTEDAIAVIPGKRDHAFLRTTYTEEYLGVLAIKPEPSWLMSKLADIALTCFSVGYLLVVKASDFMFKWGEKTCPTCLSTDLLPFTFESSDEVPHHYCNGCNTVWTPRSH